MKKYVLISPEELRELKRDKLNQQKKEEYKFIDPRLNTLMRLDSSMQNTLSDSKMSDEEKAQLYAQDVQEFLAYKKQQNQPTPSFTAEQVTPSPNINSISTMDIVKTAPKKFQGKAERLAELLKASGKVAWDQYGRLLIDGKPMDGTNIIDLVNDAIRKRKNFNPKGRRFFAEKLRSMNAPKELVGNTSYWKEEQEEEEEEEEAYSDEGEEGAYATPLKTTSKSKIGRPYGTPPKTIKSKIPRRMIWSKSTDS